MKKRAITMAIVLFVWLIVCPCLAYAESFGLNLDSMSKADLETIISEASAALERNHEVSYIVSDALQSKLKIDLVQNMTGLNAQPDWHWFGGWTYGRDWNSLSVTTEAKIDGKWLPVEAIYNEVSEGSYQLMYLSVNGQVYVEKRTSDTATGSAQEIEQAAENDVEQSGTGKVAESMIAYKGEKSSAVQDIQSMLIRLGFLNGKADGDFGAKTEAAVMEFQRQYGLEVSGIVMESDLLAMQNAVAALPIPTAVPTPVPTEIPAQAISISAEKLNNQYLENEVAADEKYKGQVLRVTGTVFSVDKHDHIFSGPTYTVALDTGDFSFYSVECEFNEEHRSDVAKLKKGKKVTIQGTCTGKVLNVHMEDCQLIK